MVAASSEAANFLRAMTKRARLLASVMNERQRQRSPFIRGNMFANWRLILSYWTRNDKTDSRESDYVRDARAPSFIRAGPRENVTFITDAWEKERDAEKGITYRKGREGEQTKTFDIASVCCKNESNWLRAAAGISQRRRRRRRFLNW